MQTSPRVAFVALQYIYPYCIWGMRMLTITFFLTMPMSVAALHPCTWPRGIPTSAHIMNIAGASLKSNPSSTDWPSGFRLLRGPIVPPLTRSSNYLHVTVGDGLMIEVNVTNNRAWFVEWLSYFLFECLPFNNDALLFDAVVLID